MITQKEETKPYFLNKEKYGMGKVMQAVQTHGLAVMPSFIPAIELGALNTEFEQLVKTRSRAIEPFALEKGEGVGIQRKKLREKYFSATADFLTAHLCTISPSNTCTLLRS